ncbi:uncharacterized protein LOC143891745 [Tasmannia lanceolata]|uniref:uncharacterized protein LOC143891745 n=1 Tax=Tasmannia lanceolata TaxID=3420 RepID=UPI0040643945
MALAAVLIREEHNQQKPIYYISKVLHEAKLRYQQLEKLAYALVRAARKLKPYFQAHTIKVMTYQLLIQILHRPETSRRLVKWAVELSEFDIRYLRRVPHPKLKQFNLRAERKYLRLGGKIQAEVVEPLGKIMTISPEEPSQEETNQPWGGGIQTSPGENDPLGGEPLWELYVDGSSNKLGSGAGLILTRSENFDMDYAVRFGFRASNNEAKYEALIARMNIAV